MQEKIKQCSLVVCLFVFLFVIIGNGFHLKPGGAFVAALSGTPVVIYAFNRWSSAVFQQEHGRHTSALGGNVRDPHLRSEPIPK